MWNYIKDNIMDLFRFYFVVREKILVMEDRVLYGVFISGEAADMLMRDFMKD